MKECPEQFLEKVQKSMSEFHQFCQKVLARARHVYFFDFRISTLQGMSYDTHRTLRRCGTLPEQFLEKSEKSTGEIQKNF